MPVEPRGQCHGCLETFPPLVRQQDHYCLQSGFFVCGLVFYFNHLLGGKYECSEVSCFGRMGFFLCLLHMHTYRVDGTLCLSYGQHDGRNVYCLHQFAHPYKHFQEESLYLCFYVLRYSTFRLLMRNFHRWQQLSLPLILTSMVHYPNFWKSGRI